MGILKQSYAYLYDRVREYCNSQTRMSEMAALLETSQKNPIILNIKADYTKS